MGWVGSLGGSVAAGAVLPGTVGPTGVADGYSLLPTTGNVTGTQASVTAGADSQGSVTLSSDNNDVTLPGPGTGGITLPNVTAARIAIFNNSASLTLDVYPPSSHKINNLATNAAYAIAPKNTRILIHVSSTQWGSVAG